MDRRSFLRTAGIAAASTALVHEFWRDVADAATVVGSGPYGQLGPADARSMQLPAGFTSRIVATTGQKVAATDFTWHAAPDGGACFVRPGGGWVYVSNAELAAPGGGAGAIVFDAAGQVVNAFRVLSGTRRNCSGGPTPWGTWLSCEETAGGQVWECDPQAGGQGEARPALGAFAHEAAAVDPATSIVYLTEDDASGRLYRFVPDAPGDLTSGRLEAASVSGTSVTWRTTSITAPDRSPNTSAFVGGEGAWVSGGSLFFTTKGDNRVWELVLATQTLTVLYSFASLPGAALSGVDNITGHAPSGDLYVSEDGGNLEVCILALDASGERVVAPFARLVGHSGSELTGPAFSPDGSRLYFSSQRGVGGGGVGVTYEVTGPFRVVAAEVGPIARFTTAIDGLDVHADASTSTAAVGTLTGWAWDFGDGTSATGAITDHRYAGAGTYRLSLTVTDDTGGDDSLTRDITVSDPVVPPPVSVSFVAAASANLNVTSPSVVVPAAVQSGDVLVVVVTLNRNATATTPSGWTLLGTVADPYPDTRSWLFTRVATAATARSRVSVRLSAQGKAAIVVAAYRGASPALVVAGTEELTATTNHRSPALPSLRAGSWVLGYWADESSSNTGWTAPAGHRVRATSVGSNSGRITALAADVGPLGAGPWAGAVAVSRASSRKSVAWSIGLSPV